MRLSKSVFRTRRILVLFVMLMSLRAPIHGMAQSAETFSNMDFALSAAVDAIEKGANGFLCKPFTDRQLNDALEELLSEA